MKWQDAFLAYRKANVADLKNGMIVRYQGEWGVIFQRRWLDRWVGGPVRLKRTAVVEVMERKP